MVDVSQNESCELPDTCTPVDVAAADPEPCWGRVLPIGCKQSPKVLIEDSYTFGRSPKCEVYIAKDHVDQRIYTCISKYHFKITRKLVDNINMVYLEDLSSNGTYVNGILVGRDLRTLLANSDEISLAGANNKLYVFVDFTVDSWLSQSLRSQYQILKHLGSGGFSDVKLVIHKITCDRFAMKKVLKGRLEDNKIYNEAKLLQRFNHPFIIRLQNIIDTPEAIYLSLEYMPGGDLLKKIQMKKKLREREAKFVLYQLVLALQYLHKQDITHRDIKAENVLIYSEVIPEEPHVKITDFGLSKIIDSSGTNLKTTCGTLKYIAPEILFSHFTGPYTNAVDIWSLGVLVFLCLSGKYPFSDDDSSDLKLKIMQGSYTLSCSWHGISKPAINIVKEMLVTCPVQRIKIAQILNHRWFQDHSVTDSVDRIINNGTFYENDYRVKRQKVA